MADDRWSRLTVKSRWQDVSAGGGPSCISWRENYQWLLSLKKQTRLLVEVKVGAPQQQPAHAVGILVARGNDGPPADGRRRKLRIADGDVVAHAEARVSRRTTLQLALPASPTPYVIAPYLAAPGAEEKFTLTLLSDDTDDDGVVDFGFAPVRPPTDWHVARRSGSWARSAAARGASNFFDNMQIMLGLDGPSRARVIAFVETIGVATDMRAEAGMQTAPRYPQVGLVVFEGAGSTNALKAEPSAGAHWVAPAAADGVVFEGTLGAGGKPHVFIPHLGPGMSAADVGELTFALTVYSDAKIVLDAVDAKWRCDVCHAVPRPCPTEAVLEKMEKIEEVMDHRLRMLEAALASPEF